jgi:UTP--glucose-1-phosphate uridylyltransferase
VLTVIIEEVVRAGINDMCFIVHPDDEHAFRSVAGDHAGRLSFVYQHEPRGYGHALWCAREYAKGESFLHLVGDHLYVSRTSSGCAQRVVSTAEAEACAISAVQSTREGLLPNFGAVGGKRVQSRNDLYTVENVIEKPTPTEAEQRLITPGLRAGHYLCFFGIHVLTPTVMDILDQYITAMNNSSCPTISHALQELAKREKYLALEMDDYRYNVGVKYGLLNAQMALALSGTDRDEVIAMLMEMLVLREQHVGERRPA